jgi:hypothetical protein
MRIERQALAGPLMFRFLFRFASPMVTALSFLFVVYGGTKSIANQTLYQRRRPDLGKHPPELAVGI